MEYECLFAIKNGSNRGVYMDKQTEVKLIYGKNSVTEALS